MINDLPTVFEVVTGNHAKEATPQNNGNKNKSSVKMVGEIILSDLNIWFSANLIFWVCPLFLFLFSKNYFFSSHDRLNHSPEL